MILNTNIRILDKRILITNTTDLDRPTLGVDTGQFWPVQVGYLQRLQDLSRTQAGSSLPWLPRPLASKDSTW